ncbi:unnamed protein product [Blepharisma stoltei]|uniref:Ubiquitin-like domain-containing protein n=1 Tax=Blepharisma stoltei TaxID=1481888 RepID=A0AAU9JHX4_9CILI|nr:unnamed protein product [Blepharisma stoltei]
MQIFVYTLVGTRITLNVDPLDMVDRLKALIEESQGVPADQHGIVFAGRLVESGKSLASYNIIEGSNLHMVIRCNIGRSNLTIAK